MVAVAVLAACMLIAAGAGIYALLLPSDPDSVIVTVEDTTTQPSSTLHVSVLPAGNVMEGGDAKTITVTAEVSRALTGNATITVNVTRRGGPPTEVAFANGTMILARTATTGSFEMELTAPGADYDPEDWPDEEGEPDPYLYVTAVVVAQAFDDDTITGDGKLAFSGAWK